MILLNYLKKILLINKMQRTQSNQQYLSNTTKQIYFKWVNTMNTFYLPIDTEWSLFDLIQYVKIVVQNKNIELVQGGQGTDILRAEDGSAVEGLTDVKIFDKFTVDWCNNNLVFYIRKIPEVIATSCGGGGGSGLEEVALEEEEVALEEEVNRDCVICMESFPITDYTPYGCQHFACINCVKSCIQTNNNRCSICRIE